MAFTKFVGYTLLLILNLLVVAFTLSTLWGWFIVPLGFPVIGMVHAYGLSLVMVWLKSRNKTLFKPEVLKSTTVLKSVVGSIGMCLIALILGSITSLFM